MAAFAHRLISLSTAMMLFLISQVCSASEQNGDAQPWETVSVNLGVFISSVDSNFRIGSGIGLGFDALGIKMEADGEDWPSVDFKGNVEFNYTGLQLYLRWFY